MSYYVASGKQLIGITLAIAVFLTVCIWFGNVTMAYLDLPEVFMSEDKCVKVVNFKNGDGYTCQDKDVVLRKYKLKSI